MRATQQPAPIVSETLRALPHPETGYQPARLQAASRSEIVVRLLVVDGRNLDEHAPIAPQDAFVANVPLPNRLEIPEQQRLVSFIDLRSNGARTHRETRCVQFHFPCSTLKAIAEETGHSPVESLDGKSLLRVSDSTFYQLAMALEPTLLQPLEASSLFVCNVTRAAAVHFTFRFGQKRATSVYKGGLAPWQQKRAQEMLEANLDRNISLPEIASHCGLSVRHFSRAFSQSMGMPPQRYIIKRRVETAKQLLRNSGLSLTHVAKRAGFADQSHLSRVFSKWTGQSPGSWRRANAADPREI